MSATAAKWTGGVEVVATETLSAATVTTVRLTEYEAAKEAPLTVGTKLAGLAALTGAVAALAATLGLA